MMVMPTWVMNTDISVLAPNMIGTNTIIVVKRSGDNGDANVLAHLSASPCKGFVRVKCALAKYAFYDHDRVVNQHADCQHQVPSW